MTVEQSSPLLDQRVRAVLEGTAATTGEAFFRATVRHLAEALEVSHVFIAECVDEERTRLRTLAFWSFDDYAANFEYEAVGTPCEAVMRDESTYYADDLQGLFPIDADLRDLGARSYVAVPVHDAAGAVVGHLAAMDTRPMPEDRDHWILRVFAARVGAEFERLLNEGRLRESEARARTLADHYFDGITLAVDGLMVYANPALCALAGCDSADEMVGRPPTDFIVPEHREQVAARMREVLAGGSEEHHEYRGLRKDGTELPVEILSRRIMFEGRPALLAAIRDLTSRQESETARDQAEADLRRVLDAVPDLIWSGEITPEGVIRYRWASPAFEQLTGRSPTFLEGDQIRWLSIVYPDDRGRVKDYADQLISGERERNDQEYRIVRPDGSVRWVRDSAVVTECVDGVRPIQGIISDITEQKALTERLVGAKKLESVGLLAAGVAHNFNNALTVIYGRCELLLLGIGQDDARRRELRGILDVAERMAAMTQKLREFGQQHPLSVTVLDAAAAVGHAELTVRGLLPHDIALVTRIDQELGAVRASHGLIEQVILNLALNARDAMPEGGRLVIDAVNVELGVAETRTRPELSPGQYVCLVVSDTGTGMDEETLARAFEPFFTTKSFEVGGGLGLSTLHGMIERCEGHIEAKSALGHGSSFTVYLPRATEVEVEVETVPTLARDVESGRETILVVDDHEHVREAVVETLRHYGYDVLEADGGPSALRVLEGHAGPINLLLTDIVMPDMSGHELAARVRESRLETKVLLMTGFEGPTATAVEGSADATRLQKPFLAGVLAKKVRDVLDEST